jgi:hypothetical protein
MLSLAILFHASGQQPSGLLTSFQATSGQQPSGLLTSFQAGVALGVGKTPTFTWVVPSCGSETTTTRTPEPQVQSAYRIVVTEEAQTPGSTSTTAAWDSGKVAANTSSNVRFGGRATALKPAAVYSWRVTTWSTAGAGAGATECESPASDPQRFVTALFNGGWHPGAKWIWPRTPATGGGGGGSNASHFAFFRRVVDPDNEPGCSSLGDADVDINNASDVATTTNVMSDVATVTRALLYVTATVDSPMLAAYKAYIGGALVGVGPGRGEAPIVGGNGTFFHR